MLSLIDMLIIFALHHNYLLTSLNIISLFTKSHLTQLFIAHVIQVELELTHRSSCISDAQMESKEKHEVSSMEKVATHQTERL